MLLSIGESWRLHSPSEFRLSEALVYSSALSFSDKLRNPPIRLCSSSLSASIIDREEDFQTMYLFACTPDCTIVIAQNITLSKTSVPGAANQAHCMRTKVCSRHAVPLANMYDVLVPIVIKVYSVRRTLWERNIRNDSMIFTAVRGQNLRIGQAGCNILQHLSYARQISNFVQHVEI
jgi:hypothetical protein